MSEQQAEPTSDESGSIGPVISGSSDAQHRPVSGASPEIGSVESPRIAPDQEETAPRPDAPRVEAAKPEASRTPGKLMIMSPSDRAWAHEGVAPEAAAGQTAAGGVPGKRRIGAMAAVVALAVVAGALGGALATAGLGHVVGADTAAAGDHALEATVARIDADVVALKASVEHTSRTDMAQLNKTSDRLDKLEKAQAEPAAKLAKLSEAVEKLRPAPATAPAAANAAQAAQKEVTGSVTPPSTAPAALAAAAPKADAKVSDARNEVGRLPTLDDWVLRDVGNGGALIEGRRGMYEVYAGDPVPGLGRVDAIRRQDGHWVVVTSRGLIVAR